MRIIRYRIEVDDEETHLVVPDVDRPILHVACRNEHSVDVWVLDVLHEPGAPVRDACLRIVGTGHEFSPDNRWHGTALTPSGIFVWHVLELENG